MNTVTLEFGACSSRAWHVASRHLDECDKLAWEILLDARLAIGDILTDGDSRSEGMVEIIPCVV